jgi:hypothetical protein
VTRERIGSLVLRAYPTAVRLARGPEMLSMLLDAGEQSALTFTRECGSLVIGGLRERVRARSGRTLLVVPGTLIAILALGAVAIGLKTSSPAQSKSDMRSLAAAVAPSLRHGDLVLVAEPDQTPVAYKYLPNGLRYATPLGLDDHPGVTHHRMDSSLASAYRRASLESALTTLTPGQHVLFIRPLTAAEAGWSSRRVVLIRLRAAQVGELLAQDPKLRVVASAPREYRGPCCVTDSALLYVKT